MPETIMMEFTPENKENIVGKGKVVSGIFQI